MLLVQAMVRVAIYSSSLDTMVAQLKCQLSFIVIIVIYHISILGPWNKYLKRCKDSKLNYFVQKQNEHELSNNGLLDNK